MMFRHSLFTAMLLATIVGAPPSSQLAAQSRDTKPETVIVTLHARQGAETELAQVLSNHWETARRLGLVLDSPHLTLKGTEGSGDTYFVDIFTWRDANAPDSAPAAIQALWSEMHKFVESRGGKAGLEIAKVSLENESRKSKNE